MLCMEKEREQTGANQPFEKAFGGAVPVALAQAIDELIRETGWTKKRVVAAALWLLLKEAKKGDTPENSPADAVYKEVYSLLYPTEPGEDAIEALKEKWSRSFQALARPQRTPKANRR